VPGNSPPGAAFISWGGGCVPTRVDFAARRASRSGDEASHYGDQRSCPRVKADVRHLFPGSPSCQSKREVTEVLLPFESQKFCMKIKGNQNIGNESYKRGMQESSIRPFPLE
jgi:hypothetical protein